MYSFCYVQLECILHKVSRGNFFFTFVRFEFFSFGLFVQIEVLTSILLRKRLDVFFVFIVLFKKNLPFPLFLTGLKIIDFFRFKMVRKIVSQFLESMELRSATYPFAFGHDPRMLLIDRMEFKFETTKSRKCNYDFAETWNRFRFDRKVPLQPAHKVYRSAMSEMCVSVCMCCMWVNFIMRGWNVYTSIILC